MVDLIERERKEHQIKLDEIRQDNKRWRNKRTLCGIVAATLGSGLYFFGNGSESETANIMSSAISSFLAYQLLTSQSAVIKNPLSILNPITFFKASKDIIQFVIRGGETVESEIRFRKKYASNIESEGLLHRRANMSSLEILEGGECGLEDLVDLFESEKASEKKRNLVNKLSDWFFGKLAVKRIRKGLDTPVRKILGEVGYYLSKNELGYAEQLIVFAVKRSRTVQERINCLCVHGYFLESQGRSIEASHVFSEVLGHLKDGNLDEIDERTKNHVFVHNSPLLGRTFVFKTKDDNGGVYVEQQKTRFFYEISPSFVIPLGVITNDGKPYSTVRWAGKFSLKDYVLAGHQEEAVRILDKSLEAILLLHLRSKNRLGEAGRFFEHENFGSTLWYKFIEREGFYNSALLDVTRGIGALDNELDTVWRATVHGDLHPGNIRIDKAGEICIIDSEDGVISSPYTDPVTLVENCLFREMLTTNDCLRYLETYSGNAVDSGKLMSGEESMRYLHLSGAFKHLVLFSSVKNFTGPDDVDEVRGHHMAKSLAHLEALESFGISRMSDLRGLKTCLEGVYCEA